MNRILSLVMEPPIALLSVSNKTGLVPLAKGLTNQYGFRIISSGGTAKVLEEANIPVQRVADYTGAPEILGGRVKTLHPRIHGGILAKRNNSSHLNDLKDQSIPKIDLVVVNLYPFRETIADPNATWSQAFENIDIGGPTMVRAAAKNYSDVAILTRPEQYENYLNALKNNTITEAFRKQLALEAFEHTASYDVAISKWLGEKIESKYSPWLESIPKKKELRYGENPHQKAYWYSKEDEGWGAAIQLQGKELSTNNLLDLESALNTVRNFGYCEEIQQGEFEPAAVVIKHTNPCGVATSHTISTALKKALDGDRISAFGGIVALNTNADAKTANELKGLFLECIVAPGFDKDAQKILSEKPNLRLLEISKNALNVGLRENIRSILGGLLIQDQDERYLELDNWNVSTKQNPTDNERKDLIFSWKVVKHVRSNAIVVAKSCQTLGIGAGQMNRIGSATLALEAAGDQAQGAVLASDGFFPFDDTIKLAAKYGIKSIVQPGGSIKDNDSINACNNLGISMVLTGKRHFLH